MYSVIRLYIRLHFFSHRHTGRRNVHPIVIIKLPAIFVNFLPTKRTQQATQICIARIFNKIAPSDRFGLGS